MNDYRRELWKKRLAIAKAMYYCDVNSDKHKELKKKLDDVKDKMNELNKLEGKK